VTRTVLTLAALTLLPGVVAAAEPPSLDEEFLEYLAQFEGQADNWTWFADDDEEPKQPASPATREKAVER
jgi:hypothetical protein